MACTAGRRRSCGVLYREIDSSQPGNGGVTMSAAASSLSKERQHRMKTSNQDEIVTKHAPLVKRIAYHLMSRLPPSVQADDLIQAGIRIRGAMLDEIRRNDWAPRSVHRKARKLADAVRQIENRERRDARDHEVARELGMSLDEYHQILQDASGYLGMSFVDLGVDEDSIGPELADRAPGPVDRVQNDAFKRSLSDAIASLPDRERLVMTLNYDEELNLREIGAVIGVSESRVSQIHSQALIRLQARLGRWLDTDDA